MGNDIRALLQEELGLYQALRDAAAEQLERIEENDLPGFTEAADRRNGIQEAIASLDDLIRTSLRALPEVREQGFVRALRESMAAAAEEARAIDGKAYELATKKRDQASCGLERLKRGRKGVRRYIGPPLPQRPRFIDQKG